MYSARFFLQILAIVVVTATAFQGRPDTAAAACCFGVISWTAFRLGKQQGSGISWHALIPLYYSAFFLGAPLIEQISGSTDYTTTPETTGIYLLLTLAIVIFSVSSQVSLSATRHFTLNITDKYPLNLISDFPTVLVLFAIGWSAKYYSITSGYFGLTTSEATKVEASALAGIASVISGATTVVLACAWDQYYKTSDRKWKLFALVCLTLEMGTGLLASSKTALLMPLVIVAFVGALHGKAPKKSTLIALAAFAVFIVFPFVFFTRAATRILHADSKTELYNTLMGMLVSGDWLNLVDTDTVAGSATKSLGRDLLFVLTTIVQETGKGVRFLNGESYLAELAIFVPRFIWPDKPDLNIGNFVGHLYNLIPATDNITNISASQIGFMYMNFGTFGVVVGMTAWGMVATGMLVAFGRKSWFTAILATYVIWQEKGIAPLLFFTRDVMVLMTLAILSRLIIQLFRVRWNPVTGVTGPAQ